MSNFWSLTKINVLQLFVGGFNVDNKSSKKKTIITYSLLGVLLLYLVGWISFLGYKIGKPLQEVNMEIILLLLAFIITSVTLLMQVIFSSFNLLFKAKDYELLSTLPIKQSTVVASKVFSLYIFCLAFSAVFFIPLSVMYFVFGGFSFVALIMAIVGFLLTPLFPIFIGMVFSLIVNLITSKMRNKAIFTILFSIGLTVALMYLSQDFNGIMNGVISDANASFKTMSSIYFPAMLITNAVGKLQWLQFLYFILISIIPIGLMWLGISFWYKPLNNLFAKSAK